MLFTDSHCHIDFIEFEQSRNELLQACNNANIHRIIVPGITAKSWPRLLQTCQSSPSLFPCLGLHPWWINKANNLDLDTLEQHLCQQKLIALGEIGIDGGIADIGKQTHFFDLQLDLAQQFNLPVLVHHRKSHHLIVPILKQKKLANGGVIHAFSGSYQQAKAYIDLGFKLGIGGTITYERANKTREAIKKIPVESILLETDAPAMPLAGHQGQDNSPLMLLNIFAQLCKLRCENAEILADKIEQNIEQLFFLSKP
ncbi:TatD family hydrolase [Thalassomonas sp. M1454]|uniref:TatD family hydrolase n=1 Tax=Thalassomonas sp. M1454 TaxID=2594477 RepID=UPI00117E03F8|nr:TatD family hydrolase [Thalassomonas sp. M1454]TRX55766.1 TatD family deoxyribonuclease [Thalassomonas sp. M1454]